MLHVWLSGVMLALSATGAFQAADPTVASVKSTFDLVKGNILKAAAQVPDDMYAFKPTPDVRSMAAPQIMKFASAIWANSAPIERTSGVGLKAYMSSGTCAAALRMLPFTRSNVLLTLATVESAA